MKNALPGYKYDKLMNVLRTGNGSSQDMREIQDMKKRAELSDHYSYRHRILSVNYVFINNLITITFSIFFNSIFVSVIISHTPAITLSTTIPNITTI